MGLILRNLRFAGSTTSLWKSSFP